MSRATKDPSTTGDGFSIQPVGGRLRRLHPEGYMEGGNIQVWGNS